MDIGSKIKRARENKGLTQDELANKLKISKSALWNYENNKRNIPIDILIKCSNLLDVNFIAPALEKVTITNPNETEYIDSSTENDIAIIESLKNDIKTLNKLKEDNENIINQQKELIETQKKLINAEQELLKRTREMNPKIQFENPDFIKLLVDKIATYAFKNNLININNEKDNKVTIEMKLLEKDSKKIDISKMNFNNKEDK